MSSAPPFGIILPSRPVLTNPTIVSPTQYAFVLPSTPKFSHIVVFLLPGAILPDDTLAGVYVQLPGSSDFELLGAIGAEKQSAIFRVSGEGAATNDTDDLLEDEMTDVDDTLTTINGTATKGEVTVGIAIEPATSIAAQLQTLRATSLSAVVPIKRQQPLRALSTKVLAQRIIKNAFNFLASFAGSTGAGGQEAIPLKIFQDWWSKFERRIDNDPGFLEREADS